jgi:hypothetical protein
MRCRREQSAGSRSMKEARHSICPPVRASSPDSGGGVGGGTDMTVASAAWRLGRSGGLATVRRGNGECWSIVHNLIVGLCHCEPSSPKKVHIRVSARQSLVERAWAATHHCGLHAGRWGLHVAVCWAMVNTTEKLSQGKKKDGPR